MIRRERWFTEIICRIFEIHVEIAIPLQQIAHGISTPYGKNINATNKTNDNTHKQSHDLINLICGNKKK